MSSTGLSKLTSAIFVDSQMRAEFFSDPGAFIARFNLNAVETKSVLSCYDQLGIISGESAALDTEIGAFDGWI
jgi:hypothetical protein